jgi:serine/threonine-protein kinase
LGKPTKEVKRPEIAPVRENLLKRFSGLILYVLITILVISLYVGKYGFLENLAVQMQDGMFKLRGRMDAPPANVVIVGIDDRSVDHVGKWPWQRDLLAGLVFAVSRGSPRVIGLDVFLPEQIDEDTSGRTDILAHEISVAGNVILPIYFSYSDVGILPVPAPDRILKSAFGEGGNLNNTASSVMRAKHMYHPSQALVEVAHRFGHINIDNDADGLVRREPLLVRYDGSAYPSFGLQLAGAYLGISPSQIKPGEGNLKAGKLTIPSGRAQRMSLNYRGPDASFKRVSAVEVLAGELSPEVFKDKVVLLGLTATESQTWVNIPAFGKISEVERIATVTENIIHRDFLKHLPPLWSFLILIVIGVFCAVVLPNVSLIHRMVILLVFLFVVFNLSYILFSSFGTLTKPVYPILELVLFLLAAPAIKAKQSEKEAREKGRLAADPPEAKSERLANAGRAEEAALERKVEAADAKKREESIREETEQIRTGPAGQRGDHKRRAVESETSSWYETQLSVGRTTELPKSWEPPSPLEEGSTPTPVGGARSLAQFGRYRIVEVLGRGGMGSVYKGVDPILDRPVALKTIRLDFTVSPEEIKLLKQRLIQEAKAAGKLSHPNIVTVYDVGEQEGLYYIAMEYLSGYTLQEFIRKKGDLNYRIAAKIIIQTCEALSYAHGHGIVHRDIKPANIMLLENFHAKVMDFGVARLDTTSLTQSNVALGTPHYISPEQLEGRAADKRSDIFSLGVVIYELLTRQKPFQGENISSLMYRILNYDPAPPSTIMEKTPAVFDHIVSKAMQKRPENRYQDADEVAKALKEFVSGFVVSRGVQI